MILAWLCRFSLHTIIIERRIVRSVFLKQSSEKKAYLPSKYKTLF